jgi:hypothetical protein
LSFGTEEYQSTNSLKSTIQLIAINKIIKCEIKKRILHILVQFPVKLKMVDGA